jgi:hypothetical protein
MAGITINQLPSASRLLSTDILLASSGSVTSQVTVANLRGSIISGSDFISSFGGALQSTNLVMFSGSTALTSSRVSQLVSLDEEFINTRFNISASVNLGILNSINNFSGSIVHEGPVIVTGSVTSSGNIFPAGISNFGSIGGLTNIFVGSSLLYITTGYNNTSVGKSSILNIITGSNNTAIGAFTCQYCNGSGNTALGSLALISYNSNTVSSMNNNTAIGMYTLRNNTTGSFNTSIGAYSLTNNTIGNNNIAIGYNAGAYTKDNTPATSLTGSILIGGQSEVNSPSGSNEIIIATNDGSSGATSYRNNNIVISKSSNLFGMVSIKGLIIDDPFASQLPTIPTDPGTTGTVLVDSNYIYVCIATNSWKRTALGSTF